jgi:class 3 adenylate cyclase/predicted ATPase
VTPDNPDHPPRPKHPAFDSETVVATGSSARGWRDAELPDNLPKRGARFGGDDGRRFELIELLGKGAMGAVFLARDHVLERTVAVKFIFAAEHVSSEEMVRLVRQEARAAARLNHESIMRVFDLDTFQGMPFLVMEHLEGQSLASIAARTAIDTLRATRILADVARGLAHAHRIGVVHCDLKPSNIFITKDGRAKILDFGLATTILRVQAPLGDVAVISSSQVLAGTPRYMSPEQWRGEPLDGRTDLWALGVILFELLTGRAPLDAADLMAMREHLLSPEPLPSLRTLRPDSPIEADELLARALAKDLTARFASADEFLEALVRLELALTRSARASAHEGVAPRPRMGQRQTTLVSIAVANASTLSDQFEPEVVSDLVSQFVDAGRTVVRQLEGTPVASVGGRVVACFGYPLAHEDDAQRAVRAALLVADEVRSLERDSGVPLRVRIGIHTGPVFVSGEAGAGDVLTLQGDTADVTMWLERRAEPGAILLSGATAALAGWLFELSPLGKEAPDEGRRTIEVFRVLEQKLVSSRFEQAARSGLTPLVARDNEMAQLAALWSRAVAAEGQLVLVSGEAGIGKSRLVEELKHEVARHGATTLSAQCWAYFQHAAFHPVTELLQRTIGLAAGDTPADRLAKLTTFLSRLQLDPSEHGPLLANLLSIPAQGRFPTASLSPDVFRLRLMDALMEILTRLSSQAPTLLVVEDVHWSDASTLELLAALLDRMAAARILAVVTFRPEHQHTFPTRAHLHHMQLARLSAEATAEMVTLASRGRLLSSDLAAPLAERTDGIPLFVEELTRVIVESMRDVDQDAAPADMSVHSIPTTLTELLFARLDRLPIEGKEAAQLGAVLGRDFSFTLIERASHLESERLRLGLMQLIEAGLVRHEPGPGGARYVFKHALVQEAAYRSLLKSQRQQHHRRVADTLVRHFTEVAEQQPELLAYHFAEAGAAGDALPYLEKAGERAVQRWAHTDAISHYRRALDCLGALPDEAARARKELSLRLALGSPLMAVKGYGNLEVESNYQRALVLCRGLGDDTQLFPATLGLWQFSMVRGQIPVSLQLGRQLLAQAQSAGNATSIMLARRALGTSLLLSGDLTGAYEHTTAGLALYDPQQHGTLGLRFGHDPGVAHGLYQGLALWLLGRADEAIAASSGALDLARRLKHPVSIAFALCYHGIIRILRGEYAEARVHAEDAMSLAAEQHLALWSAMSRIVAGWAAAGLSGGAEGVEVLRDGVAAWVRTGARAGVTFFHAAHAWALLLSGRAADALRVIEEGDAIGRDNGEAFVRVELLRLRAEALASLPLGRPGEAETVLHEALAVAREQQSRAFGLRAALSLGGLLAHRDDRAEASALVQAAHDWFTQGYDTVDLRRAREFLVKTSATGEPTG